MPRPDWDQFFLQLARTYATRATCDRRHVGCILVADDRVIAAGYNGSLPGDEHCDDVGHDIVDDSCVRTIHAETNAIISAARTGTSIWGASAYLTHSPCWACCRLLLGANVSRLVYAEAYRLDERIVVACKEHYVALEHIPLEAA